MTNITKMVMCFKSNFTGDELMLHFCNILTPVILCFKCFDIFSKVHLAIGFLCYDAVNIYELKHDKTYMY